MAGLSDLIPWLRKVKPGPAKGTEGEAPASSPRSRRRSLRGPELLEDRVMPSLAPLVGSISSHLADAPDGQDAPSTFLYQPTTPGELTLRLDGLDLQIVKTGTDHEVARKPLADTTNVVVNGVDFADDTLMIDFHRGKIPINGGSGQNTIVGAAPASTFVISGDRSGTVNVPAAIEFHEIQNLTGGAGADTFTILGGAIFDGTIDGGPGDGIGPLTVSDTGSTGTDTLSVKSSAVGDVLADSGTEITSTSYPSATITYSGLDAAPTLVVPSGPTPSWAPTT